MIRAAAKGALLHGKPIVVINPEQYTLVIDELRRNNGDLRPNTIKRLAVRAFKLTAEYDNLIKDHLKEWIVKALEVF
jgi:phosphoribosylaminoimidazolecarboxamide formyltransferase/IMP cyclohydrolase